MKLVEADYRNQDVVLISLPAKEPSRIFLAREIHGVNVRFLVGAL
jgi:hypothetical protein